MTAYVDVREIPATVLAYMIGRSVAIAQIEVNSGAGRDHAIELHALAAAATMALGATEVCVLAMPDFAAAVDALGGEIRRAWPGAETCEMASDRELCRRASDGLLL